jgi:hypothetical protein
MPSNGQRFNIVLSEELATRMSCQEAECQQYRNGWVTTLDEGSEQGASDAHWIRTESKRGFIECRSEDALTYLDNQGFTFPPGLTVFIFAPGQDCFREHKDREVVFLHQRGLLVGAHGFQATAEPRVHTRPQDFNEHFNESAYAVERMVQRG